MVDENLSSTERCASFEAVRAKARALRAASIAIRQQLSATQQGLVETLNDVRATRVTVRRHLASLRPAVAIEVAAELPDGLPVTLAAVGLDPDALDEVTTGLIAAYREAVATDDDEMARLLGDSLRLIGRHLARQIGPKAAGVILN